MRVAILGTRGIPNNYGGFEKCAEEVSRRLVHMGHSVIVYVPSSHPFEGNFWQGVEIQRVRSFLSKSKLAVVFYDFLCLADVRMRQVDVILELGYSPAGLFLPFFRRLRVPIVTNMDGMDWKRSKWGLIARNVIRLGEHIAVRMSSAIIADNLGIKQYLDNKYKIESRLIVYGAEQYLDADSSVLYEMALDSRKFFLMIARLQSDNNIELVLDGYVDSGSKIPFIVIGNYNNQYGRQLKRQYHRKNSVRFVGSIYDNNIIGTLRNQCRIYFHGHSAGGTNPSLIEAMASRAPIVAHNNKFNKAVLSERTLYFNNVHDVESIINNFEARFDGSWIENNLLETKVNYDWEVVAKEYERVLKALLEK